ncbi:hypothetical protein JZ785_04620 [Alicyclobacillus curvatus]|nr:hypothetical protein JZ785_04620 [Alicyclobacillus curvatus]
MTIEYEGLKPWKAKELVIGKYAGQRPKLPEYLNAEPADSSRLLEAAEQKHKERQEQIKPVVSYNAVWKEENGNV